MVNKYGRQLLWAQAIAANEKPTAAVITAKQNAYAGIAASIKQNEPGVYPLFQGKLWTTRLEIGFAALFAALAAGLLVLLIAITLIVLKLSFLLLLVAGPFFLIVGTHPGFGRIVALRWAEMLIGVLLKTAAIALVLSVLLYAYSLIMGASDAALPWALKILMIALVTVAVFIYRKPFAHLFSAVGYGVIGSRERAEASLAAAGSTARRNTVDAATVGVPGFAGYRAARWARRNPGQAASLAAGVATAGTAGALAGAAAAGAGRSDGSGRRQRVQRAGGQRLRHAAATAPTRRTPQQAGSGSRAGRQAGRRDGSGQRRRRRRPQRRWPDPAAARPPAPGRGGRPSPQVSGWSRGGSRPGQAPLAGYRAPVSALRRAAAAGGQRSSSQRSSGPRPAAAPPRPGGRRQPGRHRRPQAPAQAMLLGQWRPPSPARPGQRRPGTGRPAERAPSAPAGRTSSAGGRPAVSPAGPPRRVRPVGRRAGRRRLPRRTRRPSLTQPRSPSPFWLRPIRRRK